MKTQQQKETQQPIMYENTLMWIK